jgi:hypothetical protein
MATSRFPLLMFLKKDIQKLPDTLCLAQLAIEPSTCAGRARMGLVRGYVEINSKQFIIDRLTHDPLLRKQIQNH